MKHAAVLALAAAVSGCSLASPDDGGRACTMLFAFVTVQVRDGAGQPVTDASVDVVRVATGRSIVCAGGQTQGCIEPTEFFPDPGTYAVFSDGLAVRESGEDFRVTVAQGARRAEAVLRIGSDGCHVEKRSGPDVLVLAP